MVVRFQISTVLLQWAAGGLLGLWVTTRRRQVGLGYGWLLRATYALLAAGALTAGLTADTDGAGARLRDVGSGGVAVAATAALALSVVRRSAGVRGHEEERARRRARVATMLKSPTGETELVPEITSEFPPALDLLAPGIGFVGLLGAAAAAAAAGGPYPLALARLVVGALLLGAVSDAMLLGHWYLVQPGLSRDPLRELVRAVAVVWPFEVLVFLWPTGMGQVLTGSVDDGWGGLLGWTWAACAATTIALAVLTWLALRERSYSAVMAATGLLYLAILTAFGTDLVARAVLA